MSVELPNGKIAFTLPEQVGKNAKDIEKIFQLIDGLNIQDNVVVVDDISHIMTAQELKVIKQAVSFIVYDGQLYIKKSESAGSAYFDIVFTITSGTAITFSSKEIEVNLTNGALGITISSYSAYSTTQIDTKLSAKADITYVDSNYASLLGANFSGGITAPSIIENMSGYSFVSNAKAGVTKSILYASAVKNGNKLTFAIVGTIIKTGDVDGNQVDVGRFTIPAAIGAKLYPLSGSWLTTDRLHMASGAITRLDLPSIFVKVSDTVVYLNVYSLETMTLNTTYYFRYECTFLLADNLAA